MYILSLRGNAILIVKFVDDTRASAIQAKVQFAREPILITNDPQINLVVKSNKLWNNYIEQLVGYSTIFPGI